MQEPDSWSEAGGNGWLGSFPLKDDWDPCPPMRLKRTSGNSRRQKNNQDLFTMKYVASVLRDLDHCLTIVAYHQPAQEGSVDLTASRGLSGPNERHCRRGRERDEGGDGRVIIKRKN